MRPTGEHAHPPRLVRRAPPGPAGRASLAGRLLRERRRRRLNARLARVSLREHLAYWRARWWSR